MDALGMARKALESTLEGLGKDAGDLYRLSRLHPTSERVAFGSALATLAVAEELRALRESLATLPEELQRAIGQGLWEGRQR